MMLNIGTKFKVDMKQSLGERYVFNSFELGCMCMAAGINERDPASKIVERMKVLLSVYEFKGYLMDSNDWDEYVGTAVNEWGYRGCKFQERIESVALNEEGWKRALEDGWTCNVSQKSDSEFMMSIARKVFSSALDNYDAEEKYFQEFENEWGS